MSVYLVMEVRPVWYVLPYPTCIKDHATWLVQHRLPSHTKHFAEIVWRITVYYAMIIMSVCFVRPTTITINHSAMKAVPPTMSLILWLIPDAYRLMSLLCYLISWNKKSIRHLFCLLPLSLSSYCPSSISKPNQRYWCCMELSHSLKLSPTSSWPWWLPCMRIYLTH